MGSRAAARAGLEGVRDPAAAGEPRALGAHGAGRRPRRPARRLPVRPPHRRAPRARSRAPVSGHFEALSFGGEWRPYQRAALAAFEKDRQHGRKRTHIVAPPGSGKTLLGVELIRRVGKRALVLAPNQGIQQQWPRAVGQFTRTPAEVAGADVLKPIACLSYQALCQLEDPEIVLGRLAQSRWADERAAATGMTREEVEREGEAFEGAAADRRARELSKISAALKREVARGEHAGVELRDLLSATARERVQTLATLGVGVVLLDECHHLASLWGYVVRAVLGELPDDVHVIGLTATPPVSLPTADAELYDALLGPVDFTVPDARGGPRRPPRAVPGAGLADRAAERRARLAGRARHALPRADHEPARRHRVPGVGDLAPARPPPLGRRRRRAVVGRVPEAQPAARPRRHPLPALRRPSAAARARRAARPTASRPTSRTGSCCSRTTRCAASRRRARARRPRATTRSPPRCASSASSSPARASAAARRRSTGC